MSAGWQCVLAEVYTMRVQRHNACMFSGSITAEDAIPFLNDSLSLSVFVCM